MTKRIRRSVLLRAINETAFKLVRWHPFYSKSIRYLVSMMQDLNDLERGETGWSCGREAEVVDTCQTEFLSDARELSAAE